VVARKETSICSLEPVLSHQLNAAEKEDNASKADNAKTIEAVKR
jgi:hypothetical protein